MLLASPTCLSACALTPEEQQTGQEPILFCDPSVQQQAQFPRLKKTMAKQAQGRVGFWLQPSLSTSLRRSVSAGTVSTQTQTWGEVTIFSSAPVMHFRHLPC